MFDVRLFAIEKVNPKKRASGFGNWYVRYSLNSSLLNARLRGWEGEVYWIVSHSEKREIFKANIGKVCNRLVEHSIFID